MELGDKFFDYGLNKERVFSKIISNKLQYGIVGYNEPGEISRGYYTINPCKNIIVQTSLGSESAISKDVFPENTIIFNKISGYYKKVNPEDYHKALVLSNIKGNGIFPYINIGRYYDAEHSIKKFKINRDVKDNNFKNKDVFKYTFGLEFETSKGYLPEEVCYQAGLIPLRDGSISGIEYATIPMDGKTGFDLLKYQTEVLREYTDFDKECSLHIHIGGLPVTPNHLLVLYKLAYYLQEELYNYIPGYSFNTSQYKASGKDYCKKINEYNKFSDLYEYLSGGYSSYLGSLEQNHPVDRDRQAKWNIKSRYNYLNIINMAFYKGPKTVEFRFLRPTYNFNKIVNWLYIFNAILQYTETFVDNNGTCNELALMKKLNKIIATHYQDGGLLKHIIDDIYGETNPDICEKLHMFLLDLKDIIRVQHNVRDYIGLNTNIEDDYLVTNVIT